MEKVENEIQKQKDEIENIFTDPLIDRIILNKYKILQKIGKGSFGNIYLAKESNINEYYAIKLEKKVHLLIY